MKKTTPEIAKAIIERRNRMTHVIMPGEITAEIGPDGVAEALQRRWLVPDTDDGYLCATNDLKAVEEMRQTAQMKPEEFQGQVIPVAESHDLLQLHARRSHALYEVAPPMTGATAPGLSIVAQPVTQPKPPPGVPDPTLRVGAQVFVGRGGKPAVGVIEKEITPDHFKVEFPPEQKDRPVGDNIYSRSELSTVMNKPLAAATSVSTAP